MLVQFRTAQAVEMTGEKEVFFERLKSYIKTVNEIPSDLRDSVDDYNEISPELQQLSVQLQEMLNLSNWSARGYSFDEVLQSLTSFEPNEYGLIVDIRDHGKEESVMIIQGDWSLRNVGPALVCHLIEA